MLTPPSNPQKEYWNIIATSVPDEVAATHWVDENNQPVNPAMFAEIAAYLRAEFLSGREAGQVLEIGCGNSLILAHLRSALPPAWQLHGLDISEEMLRRARSPGLILACGEANRLPYPAGSFDLIFLHGVTQYFGTEIYLREVMAEAITALRPGGTIALLDVPALWYRDLMGNRTLPVMVKRKLAMWRARTGAVLGRFFGRGPVVTDRQREIINGVAIDVPKFTGYYADMNLFRDYRRFFRKLAIEVQPFELKPEIYRKFRFNVLLTGRNDVPFEAAAAASRPATPAP